MHRAWEMLGLLRLHRSGVGENPVLWLPHCMRSGALAHGATIASFDGKAQRDQGASQSRAQPVPSHVHYAAPLGYQPHVVRITDWGPPGIRV